MTNLKSRNGWDLVGTTINKKDGTITYHVRKGLYTKDIEQSLDYYVKFESLPDFYFQD